MYGLDGRHRGLRQSGQVENRAEQRVGLHDPSGLEVMEHGCLVPADPLRTGNAPLDREADVMPSLLATASASAIIVAARLRVGGYWQMSTSVECVSALIGLNARFLRSLSQTSARMLSSTGALNPARVKHSDTARTRPLEEPSSSPTGKRSPSMWRMIPGATSSAAG